MKNIKSSFFPLLVFVCFSCNKPESVLFTDNSTAMLADKSAWTATASSEASDRKASAVIDGNIATFWETNSTVPPIPDYPHWILIDMKTDKSIVTVSLTNRQAATAITTGMKSFRLEGSKDGTTFTKLGEFNLAISNNAQSFPVSSANAYRYLKVTALSSQTGTTPHTSLAEINLVVGK